MGIVRGRWSAPNRFLWQRPFAPADIQRADVSIAERRGVKPTKVSKSGDVLRELLAIAEAAELLGIRPIQQGQPDQVQP